ncbi:MAG TPA: DUF4403 family protein, partial [Chromatiaceae bacterium]|nr:DUF4403 family protein [Chromatiaceae bacterium]
LSQRLAGRTLAIEGQSVEILDLDLSTRGGDLVLTIRIAGAAPGVLTLMARPGWNVKTSSLHLADLGFVFDADDPDQGLAVSVFYDRIRDALDRAANELLQERASAVRANLQATLDRVLSQADLTGVGLDLSGVALRDLRLDVGETGLRVNGVAGGQVRVRARP